mgnify:CR=1 FL=1
METLGETDFNGYAKVLILEVFTAHSRFCMCFPMENGRAGWLAGLLAGWLLAGWLAAWLAG